MVRQSDITRYYVNQAGSGIGNFYAGSRFQTGSGIGSFLKGIFRSVLFPFIQSGAKTVGREVARSGAHFLADVASGENVKTSAKRHLSEAGDNLVSAAKRKAQEMSGSGIKKRKVRKTSHNVIAPRRVKFAKRKRPVDIFSQ